MQEICGIQGLSFEVMVGKKVLFVMNNQNKMKTIQLNPRHLIEKIKINRNKDLNM